MNACVDTSPVNVSIVNTDGANLFVVIDPSDGIPVTLTGPYTTTASVPFGTLLVKVIVFGLDTASIV